MTIKKQFCKLFLIAIFSLTVSCSSELSESYDDRVTQNNIDQYELATLGGEKFSFSELPGYYAVIQSESGICSAVHIGNGILMTVAHCLATVNQLARKVKEHKIRSIKYHYADTTDSSVKAQGYLTQKDIKHVAVHSQFVNLNVPPVHRNQFDIALIFTKPPPFAPFYYKAFIPNDKDFTINKSIGDVWVYGAGKNIALFSASLEHQIHKKFYAGTIQIYDEFYRNHPSTMQTGYKILKALGKEKRIILSATPDKIPKMVFKISNAAKYSQTGLSETDIRGICRGDSGGPIIKKTENPSEDLLIGIITGTLQKSSMQDLATERLNLLDQFLYHISSCSTTAHAIKVTKITQWILHEVSKYRQMKNKS